MSRLIPPGAHESYLDLHDGKVRLLRGGTARTGHPPVVLIHGGGFDNSGISWYRLFEPLGADREVLALDLPGFGGTEGIEPVGGPVQLADFVARVLVALDYPRAVVIGVSMGGDVSLNLALRFPERVAALVLIAPGGLVEILKNRLTHTSAWLAAQLPDWFLLPMTALANRFVGQVLRGMVKDPTRLPKIVVDEFIREARAPNAGIAYGRYSQEIVGRKTMRNNLLPHVSAITAPTLLFHGADDPMVDLEGSRKAAALIPQAKLVVAPDCGHWAQLEEHELFLDEVSAFLREVD